MNWITEHIAIGNFIEAEEADLSSLGIKSIVCLNGMQSGQTPQEWGVDARRVFELRDGGGQRQYLEAIDTVGIFEKDFPKVLVHCQMGLVRSVIVVAGHLMKTEGLSADEALAFVASKRNCELLDGMAEFLKTMSWSSTP